MPRKVSESQIDIGGHHITTAPQINSAACVACRYEQGSLLVTSNMPFGRWGEIFSDDIVAAAMIDRLVHHAEVITLSGQSYRTRTRRDLLAAERQKTPASTR